MATRKKILLPVKDCGLLDIIKITNKNPLIGHASSGLGVVVNKGITLAHCYVMPLHADVDNFLYHHLPLDRNTVVEMILCKENLIETLHLIREEEENNIALLDSILGAKIKDIPDGGVENDPFLNDIANKVINSLTETELKVLYERFDISTSTKD